MVDPPTFPSSFSSFAHFIYAFGLFRRHKIEGITYRTVLNPE
jgi:hypothetical protein